MSMRMVSGVRQSWCSSLLQIEVMVGRWVVWMDIWVGLFQLVVNTVGRIFVLRKEVCMYRVQPIQSFGAVYSKEMRDYRRRQQRKASSNFQPRFLEAAMSCGASAVVRAAVCGLQRGG